MNKGLGDTSSVKAQITQIATQYGVDPKLALAVAQQESGFQQTGSNGQTLSSSAGALGVMQLMPTTAAGLGVDPNDQTGNITGGVKLLSQLLNQFSGNVPYALAAYNAGPGAVQKYNGIPPYAETQNYVSSIMANYQSQGGTDTVANPIPLWPSDSTDNVDTTDTTTTSASTGTSITDLIANTDPVVLGGVGLAALGLLWVMFGRG